MFILDAILSAGAQKILYLFGTSVTVGAWLFVTYRIATDVTATPAIFRSRGEIEYVDRKSQPVLFCVKLLPRLLVVIASGYFCGLLLYYKLPQIFAAT
jgi:hypothetical protein